MNLNYIVQSVNLSWKNKSVFSLTDRNFFGYSNICFKVLFDKKLEGIRKVES